MKFSALARIAIALSIFACTAPAWAAEAAPAKIHHARHHIRFTGIQCAPYARLITAIDIRGNAWTWWKKAIGQYDRGNDPKIGAVIVFKRSHAMPFGHVAVVRQVVNDREVLVEQANWARQGTHAAGKISVGDRIQDVSPNNDWTQVRVWSAAMNDFGRTNPSYGFIYSPNYDPRTGIHWQQAEDWHDRDTAPADSADSADADNNG